MLESGARLGSYEIQSALGAGGMGEVYRAKDTKLGRLVAVKILPDAVAADAERIVRFEREARALAALNHPRIAALHGMEEAGGRHFLIMELVDGETLAERLQRGRIGVEAALRIASQIADGLEAAHEKGIVHRDLKPANVKITPDEQVKILDFGLAKAVVDETARGTRGSPTQSPTLSLMATQAGVILGTAAYMAPEQANGFPADHRSDVFSFGVVLYEMLTGRQPFEGTTAAEILASVLVREADLAALPPDLNPRITEIIRRALAKNPKQRWQAMGDLRAEIEAVSAAPRADVAAPAHKAWWRRVMPAAAAAIVTGVVVGAATWAFKPPPPPQPIVRFTFPLGEGQLFTNTGRQAIVISPDGTRIVYVANQRLYVRGVGDAEPRPIAGSDSMGAVINPTFSPDSRSIAFYVGAARTIKRIAVEGGAALTVCEWPTIPFGMSWSGDSILFGTNGKTGIVRVSANGGTPQTIAAVDAAEIAYGPQLLPDGETLLFTNSQSPTRTVWDTSTIVAQSLKSGQRHTLVRGGADGRYVPTGHLVYAVSGVLHAVPFDVKRLAVTGPAVPVLEGVRRATPTPVAQFAFSNTGSLAYLAGPVTASGTESELAVVDEKGGGNALKIPVASYERPHVSPDGARLAVSSDDGQSAIVWIYEMSGGAAIRRLTFEGRNRWPVWSHDGQRVAFQSDREGDRGIFWQRVDGTGVERLTKPEQGVSHIPESISPDGQRMLLTVEKDGLFSLHLLSLADKTLSPLPRIQSRYPLAAVFSPDGKWIAYHAVDVAGATVFVFVEPFPPTGAKYQISNGINPLWSPDGRSLLFAQRGQLLRVNVATQPAFTFASAEVVPVTRTGFTDRGPTGGRSVDFTHDGQRLVSIVSAGQLGIDSRMGNQVNVVLNWFDDIRRRVGQR